MELNYVKGDLFKLAPRGAYLLHSCNCHGVWGAGIAKEFKDVFPEAFFEYKNYCQYKTPTGGEVIITDSNIVCLFTSYGYGKNRDNIKLILENTHKSLINLSMILPRNSVIYSPKINSGLFGVPWKETAEALDLFLSFRTDVSWTVVEYE